ncbi:MAG: recombinase family protein [Clostridiaceae bacterium]|nr:recombinase family protein [Clostridiaceae bacterium]
MGVIIRNPFYKGTYRYNYRESGRGKLKKKDEWIMIDNNHDAIITKEQWKKCNEIMDGNAIKNNAKYRSDIENHIFTGLLQCGECKTTMYAKVDRAHEDGYKPSIYYCKTRYSYHQECNQKTISDKSIGTFVFDFISNMNKAQKEIEYLTEDKLKAILLDGKAFKDVNDISNMNNVITALNLSFNDYKVSGGDNTVVNLNLESYKKQKNKYERALKRLNDLYLFDDESISEKDYIIKKNEINEKLDEINKKIDEMYDSSEINKSFIMQVQLFKFADLLKDHVKNYKKMVQEIGRETLRDFVLDIIEKIEILDKHIQYIEFKNGLKVQFTYKK